MSDNGNHNDFKTMFMSDSRTSLNFKYLKCPTIHPWWSILDSFKIHSNVLIVEESFGYVSRWLIKLSCPPAARWRECLCLWEDEKFAILLFCSVTPSGIPNCGVNLHFQHWNLTVNSSLDLNSSLDFSNVTNHRRCCVNLQAIWNIISTWPNNRSRGLKLLSISPKCRPLLAVKLYLFGCTVSFIKFRMLPSLFLFLKNILAFYA